LIVHLPIGFLLVAFLLEAYAKKTKDCEGYNKPVKTILLLGIAASLIAVVSGLGLASSGGFNPGTLSTHKWMGIFVLIISVVCYVLKAGYFKLFRRDYAVGMTLLVVLLLTTGHYGGVLTHGDNYLYDYAPGFVKSLAGYEQENKKDHKFPENPDSLLVFDHLVRPILEKKCVSCHDGQEMEGGLDLSTLEGIQTGGDNGEVIVSGNAMESELIRRLLLPSSSVKVMPPGGDPLSYTDTRLLVWWINSGSDFTGRFAKQPQSEEINNILLTDYSYDPRPRPYWEILKLQPLDSGIINGLASGGFRVSELGENNFLLDVEAADSLAADNVEELLKGVEHITWLKLNNVGLKDEDLSSIGKLVNLTRLNLGLNKDITDEGIKSLEGLKYLESLNLYGTAVTDGTIESLKMIKTLKRVYLWQTQVTPEGAESLRSAIEGIEVDMGHTLVAVNEEEEE